MKSLPILWRWIIGATVFIVAVAFVSHEQQVAAKKYQAQYAEYCADISKTLEHERTCIQEHASSQDYLPSWYVLVEWPQSIETWAIIGTGFFIAWQAWETRRSAQASATQTEIARKALIAQFRPRVDIRSMRIIETDDTIHLNIEFVNKGDTEAHITDGIVETSWHWGSNDKDTHDLTTTIIAFNLLPGEKVPFQVDMKEGWILYRMAENKEADGYRDAMRFHCVGRIKYKDDNGTLREMAFDRLLDHRNRRFIPSDDPEREYSD